MGGVMDDFSIPFLYRRGYQGSEGGPGEDEEPSRAEDQAILCRACGAEVTSHGAVMDMRGGHNHTFVNPHGYVFEIGCFSSAPGCVDYGAPTAEHTWFPGFSWCFSLCGSCSAHLGWRFSSGSGQVFWGLVLNRLKEA